MEDEFPEFTLAGDAAEDEFVMRRGGSAGDCWGWWGWWTGAVDV